MCLLVKLLLWQKHSSLTKLLSFGGDFHFSMIYLVPVLGINSDKTLDLYINPLSPWQYTTAENL